MKEHSQASQRREAESWVGWCCAYCSAPLEPCGHGLLCAPEGRWFATDRGVHRLLTAERRRELLPFLELRQRERRDQGYRAEPGLPHVAPGHPHAALWNARERSFDLGMGLLGTALDEGPWRVIEIGAGCAWASARLVARGHRVVAVDLSLDVEDGLPAADRLLSDPRSLPRAEADMEALPVEPGRFDLVLAAGALHHAERLTRTLVELRRVTRRGGVLLALDSPVFRRRFDGERRVADRMRELGRRYGMAVPRESQPGYFVLGELGEAFRNAGWSLEIHGWPSPLREGVGDAVSLLRRARRAARYPVLLARRDG